MKSTSGSYTSKYTSSKRYVTSTEISYADHKAKTSFQKESTMEYAGPRGTSTSSRELVSSTDIRTLPIYIATRDFKPDPKDRDALPLEEGQIVEVLDCKNPSSWLVRTKSRPPQTGWVPGSYFETPAEYYRQKRTTREITASDLHMTSKEEAVMKRDSVFTELLKTEEEFVQDLHHLIETYVKVFDDPTTPSSVRQIRDQLTLNLRELYNFHANVLLKGLQYYSDNPGKVGQTFLRLERDFDQHVRYCRDEPDTEKLIDDEKIRDHMKKIIEEVEKSAEKEMKFSDYLRLPTKRLTQYQGYIKELIKYSARADLDTESLQKALELVLSIPQRATDLNYTRNIQEYPTDLGKLGRLLRHDHFQIWENEKSGDGTLKYVFLFKSKILLTDRKEPEDIDEQPEFKYSNTIRMDKYEIKDDPTEPDLFVLIPSDVTMPKYFLKATDSMNAEFAKQAWVRDIQDAKEGLVIQEEEMDILTEFVDVSDVKSEFSEYSTPSRKGSVHGPDDEPPRKKPKTPPAISPSGSSASIYSSNGDLSGTGQGTLDMQGTSVTRTQYGFRTFQESSAKMCLKVSGYPLPVITWFKDGVQLNEDERHKFYSDDDGFFALTIDPVLVDDTGRYTCVATNEYGQATTSAFFRVVKAEKETAGPQFLKELKDVDIVEGEAARFECEVEGWPEPEIQFFIDGHQVQPSHDFRIEYDGQKALLLINEAQPEDSGLYTVKISNEMGEVESRAKLRVRVDPEKNKVAPEFQQTMQDRTVDEGDTVRFKVVCTGDPTPEVFWTINGTQLTSSEKVQMLAEDGIYILSIHDVTSHFDGDVACRAVNRLGEMTCRARLNVRVRGRAPKFDQALKDVTVESGEKRKIDVAVSAEPPADVHWYLDGRPIKSEDQRFKISSVPQAGIFGLEILSANENLNGILECHAENDFGETVTKAKLTIITPIKEPSIRESLKDVTINEDENLFLQVQTEEDIDVSNVKWFLNNKELKNSWNINISKPSANTFSLEVSKISSENSGQITCKISNDAGHVETSNFITVISKPIPPPKILKSLPASVQVKEWDNLKLEIEIDSDTQPSRITWHLNETELKDDKVNTRITTSKDFSRSILEISRVSSDLSGKITCKIDNRSHSTVEETEFKVQKRPTRRPSIDNELPQSVEGKLGETLNIQVTSSSTVYEETVIWKIDNRQITQAESNIQMQDLPNGVHQMSIKKVTSDLDGKTVSCKVTNEIGSIETSTVIQAKPEQKQAEPEEQLKEITVEKFEEVYNEEINQKCPAFQQTIQDALVEIGQTARFEVKVQGEPEPEVTWFLNGVEAKESANVKISKPERGVSVLEVQNATPETAGYVECRADNEVGAKICKGALIVVDSTQRSKGKPVFEAPLSPVTVNEGETLKAKVIVSGDEPRVKWYINHKLVVQTEDVRMLSLGGVFILEVQGASPDMSGAIKCTAYNTRGEVSCDAPLSVTVGVPVEFEQYLADTICHEGDTLRLKAVLLGEPAPDVSWFINGEKLTESQNVQIFKERSTYMVLIKSITCDMSGEVVCRAVNEFGEASSSAQLIVLKRGTPPDFSEWLSNVNIKEGSTVTHKVVFTGEPSPNITWYINNREITNSENIKIITTSNSSTLIINRFLPDMVGEIICKADNDAGEVSCTANMNLFSGRMEYEETSEQSELQAVAEGDQASEAGTLSMAEDDLIYTEEESSIRVSTPIQAPKFITRIKDVRAKRGQKAIFECVVPDTKGVVVKWLKDGKEIELLARIRVCQKPGDADFTQYYQLVIESVTKGDSGVYSCILKNEAGESTTTANLEIIESISEEITSEISPEFVKNLISSTVPEGTEAVFECKVAGIPRPQVEWYKGAERLSPSRKILIESREDGLQKLIISDVKIEDSSSYRIVVSNDVGRAEQEARLSVERKEVLHAPEILQSIETATVREGEELSISCKIFGQPIPEVQWFKGAVQVRESDRISIISASDGAQIVLIKRAEIADAGSYTCVCKNKVGSCQNMATVRVLPKQERTEAPRLVSSIQSTVVEEGEDLKLKCLVPAHPEPEVKWFRDETELHESLRIKIATQSNGTHSLEIQDTKSSDSGLYTCQVSNEAGFVRDTATVVVKSKETIVAPSLLQPLESTSVLEGDDLHLKLKVASAQPEPEVRWFKDEVELRESIHVKFFAQTDGTFELVVKNSNPVDAGQYSCELKNKAGVCKTVAKVEVKHAVQREEPMEMGVAPEFVQRLQPMQVGESQVAVLECRVQGEPKPEIRWFKDGEEVKPDQKHRIEQTGDGGQKLIIQQATEDDIATYTCKAMNLMGASTTSSSLMIKTTKTVTYEDRSQLAPEFVQILRMCQAKEHEEAQFECKVTGQPAPEVRWSKDGQPLRASENLIMQDLEDGTHRLIMKDVERATSGEYRCEAYNEAGTAWSEAPLILRSARESRVSGADEIAPDFLEPLRPVLALEGEEVRMECKVIGVPAPEIQWFRNGQEMTTSENVKIEAFDSGLQKLTVKGVHSIDVGEYRCSATNEFGTVWSDATLALKAAQVTEITELLQVAPYFVKVLTRSTEATQGEYVRLSCQAKGTPHPEIRWFKDQKLIQASEHVQIASSQDGVHELILARLEQADVGIYTCEARNLLGAAKTQTSVMMSEAMEVESHEEFAPEFANELREKMVDEGRDVELECKVIGRPAPNVRWFKDGQEIRKSERIEIKIFEDGRQKLIIKHTQPEDQGNYRCEATNAAGSMSSKAPLSVRVAEEMEIEQDRAAAEFKEPLQAAKVKEGTAAKFECVLASSSKAMGVQWFKDGEEIRTDSEHVIERLEDGRQILTVRRTSVEDVGLYYCVAIGPGGKAETAASLKVEKGEKSPEFLRGLKSVKVKSGEQIVLNCQIDVNKCKRLPAVKWYKNGNEISQNNRTFITVSETGQCTMILSQTSSDDSGSYECELSNEGGSERSKADVTVEAVKPPEFLSSLQDKVVTVGGIFELEAKVSGEPFPEVKWHKDGREIRIVGNFKSVREESSGIIKLIVSNASQEEEGTYRCTLSNVNGTASAKASVTVEKKPEELGKGMPKFDRGLKDASAQQGEDVTLYCNVSGEPFPEVIWYKGNVPLKRDDQKYVIGDDGSGLCILRVKSTSKDDADVYTCKLINSVGTAHSSCSVTILEAEFIVAPEFKISLHDKIVTPHSEVAFEVEVNQANTQIDWLKDGQKLATSQKIKIDSISDTVYRLTVTVTDTEMDAGEYSCQATNEMGSVSTKAFLSVEAPEEEISVPIFRKGLSDKHAKPGQRLQLEVEIEGKPKSVKWYRNGNDLSAEKKVFMEKVDDKTYRLIVPNMAADDAGRYTVEAINDLGSSTSSGAIDVEALKFPQIVKGLKDVEAELGGKAVFELEVSGRPKVIKWYKNGRELSASEEIHLIQASESNFKMILDDVTEEDQAQYRVELSNEVGTVSSDAALTIRKIVPSKFEPTQGAEGEAALSLRIVKTLDDQSVKEKQPLMLEVQLSSAPAMIKWYKSQQELKPSAEVQYESLPNHVYRLILPSPSVDDAGIYKVVATNEVGSVSSEAKISVSAVDEKPSIVRPLKNTDVQEGSPVIMEIAVAKKPKVVKWYKNGRELSASKNIFLETVDDTHYRLIIPAADLEDQGQFTVTVANDAGSDQSQAELTVRQSGDKKPKMDQGEAQADLTMKITKGLQDKRCKEDEEAVFEIQFSVKPEKVTWFKRDLPLSVSKKIRIDQIDEKLYRLIVQKSQVDDTGLYKVEAQGPLGDTVVSSAILAVESFTRPPQILEALKNIQVPEGSQAKFEVRASGKPKVVRWYRNGRELASGGRISIQNVDDSTFQLILDNVNPEDTANFRVLLENDAGSADSEAQLTVVQKSQTGDGKSQVEPTVSLTITKCLKDQKADEGDNVGFDVELSQPAQTIKWYKNGQAITPNGKAKFIDLGENRYRLLLTDVNIDDSAAEYRVRAEKDGTVVESSARLTVTGKPPRFIKGLKNIRSVVGSKVILEIEVDGKPRQTTWYRNGKVLSANQRVIFEKSDDVTFRLILNDVKLDDQAEYKVEISNSFGSAESIGSLTVEEGAEAVKKLKFLKSLSDKIVEEGTNVAFEVQIEGRPGSVKWYKNGLQLNASSRIKIEQLDTITYKLLILEADKSDQGVFSVSAENELERIQSEASLVVEIARPTKEEGLGAKFVQQLNSEIVSEGDELTLKCRVKGEPFPEIAWLKDGMEIEKGQARTNILNTNDGSCRLTILQISREDAGTYTCLAQNVHGGDRTKCSINVESRPKRSIDEQPMGPEFLKPLRDRTVIEGEDVILEVKIIGKPMPDVCWFCNEEDIEPSDRVQGRIECIADEIVFRLYIKNARLNDSNLYKCVATNPHGRAMTSGKLTVEVLKPAEQSPPKFVIPLSDITASEGKSAIFDVKVRGRPTPELIWYKNRNEIVPSDRIRFEDMGDNRFRMTIENISSNDAGLYECKAVNSLGFDISQGNLTVAPSKERRKLTDDNFAPVFNVPLHDRKIPERNNMIVECYVHAKPRPEIQWFKDNTLIEIDERTFIENYPDGKCRLRINDFIDLDVGHYRCVATNDLGSATTAAFLSVEAAREEEFAVKKEYPLRFVRDLVDTKIKEGSSVTLECQVEGQPFPEIGWFKNGIPIKPDDRHIVETFDDGTCRLRIIDCLEDEMGAYRCLARNCHGSTNCACLLTVEVEPREKKKPGEAPIFIRGLQDCWVEKGTDIILKCQVSGDPRPSVKWYKDGTLIRTNGRVDIGYLDDGMIILTIRSSTISDEGFYRCSAENQFGEASTIGTVRIQELVGRREVIIPEGDAPKFIIELESCSTMEGSTVELECKVTGKPTPQLKWYKDGVMLYNDLRTGIETLSDNRYRLTIKNVSFKDDGNYRCVAANDFGTATSKAIIRLEQPRPAAPPSGSQAPQFSIPIGDARTNEGCPVTLECKVNGSPQPELSWFKDGELVVPTDRIRLESTPDGCARLHIDNSRPTDAGVYRCVAKNPLGTDHVKGTLTVKRELPILPPVTGEEDMFYGGKPPKIVTPLSNVRSKEGQSISLSCRITGTPTPTIKWFKDGERIYPFGRYTIDHSPETGAVNLYIDQVGPRDTGCYRCVAENDFGIDRTTAEVIIEAKERKPMPSLEDELAKGRAPGFIKPLVIQRTHEGRQAIFTCLPYGNPFPKIKWLKDGVELVASEKFTLEQLDDGTQRLTIKSCTSNDEGYYRCVASNDFGTCSTKADLIVEIDYSKRARLPLGIIAEGVPEDQKPRFRKGLQNITVSQGSTAEFECVITGEPKPGIKWFRGDEQLHASSKYLIFQDDWGFHRLVILNAQLEDQDDYRVEIESINGTAKSIGSLTVIKAPLPAEHDYGPTGVGHDAGYQFKDKALYPPGFLRQTRNRHVFSGFPAIFDCIVTGNPLPEVTWLHNNKPIQTNGRIKIQKCGGNSYALVFLRTLPEDQGEYTCFATNSQGTAGTSAVLDITVPLLDKLAAEDRNIDRTSHWLADEFDFRRTAYACAPTPPDRGPFIAEVTSHFLTLSWIPSRRPPPRYPQVTYVVEVRELPDKAWTVVDFNISQPCCKVRNLALGKSYQFRIRAENLYGISEPSPPSAPSQLMAPPKPVLDKQKRPIPNYDPYALDAMNKCYGEQYACAPWFAPQQLEKFYCAENQTLEVSFWVYGFPDPEITWLFRGFPLTPETHGRRFESKCFGGAECVLILRQFSAQDAGQYQCKAVNAHGEANQNLMVEIAKLPTFMQNLENKLVSSSKPARLDCRIDGTPYPEIKWYKDWHPLVESSRIKIINEPPFLCSLLIENPVLRDTGIYTCSAINEAGKTTSSATITVELDPYDFGYEVDYVRPPKKRSHPQQAPTPKKVREIYTIDEEIQK